MEILIILLVISIGTIGLIAVFVGGIRFILKTIRSAIRWLFGTRDK